MPLAPKVSTPDLEPKTNTLPNNHTRPPSVDKNLQREATKPEPSPLLSFSISSWPGGVCLPLPSLALARAVGKVVRHQRRRGRVEALAHVSSRRAGRGQRLAYLPPPPPRCFFFHPNTSAQKKVQHGEGRCRARHRTGLVSLRFRRITRSSCGLP